MTCGVARSFQRNIQGSAKPVRFNASNVSASLINSQGRDMSRQLPSLCANQVLHTGKALLVLGVIILLSVVWLVMIILWSIPTYLSTKVRQNLARLHGGKLHGRLTT